MGHDSLGKSSIYKSTLYSFDINKKCNVSASVRAYLIIKIGVWGEIYHRAHISDTIGELV